MRQLSDPAQPRVARDPAHQAGHLVDDLLDDLLDHGIGGRTDAGKQPGRRRDHRGAVGVWDRELDMVGAKTPAADVGALIIAERVLHGWDLAAATWQDYTVSGRAAEAALGVVEANAELSREYRGFAEPVPAAAGAPLLDRLLALSGRDPAWTPAAK